MNIDILDRQTPLFVKLKEHYTDRLAALRGQLEGNIDESLTANLRGRIAEIKALLDALQKETPPR